MRLMFLASLMLAAPSVALAKGDAKGEAPKTQPPTIIGCDAPAGHTCFFSISDAKGATLAVVTLPGGGRAKSNIRPGNGITYVVVVDRDLANDPTCQKATKAGLFCKRDKLKSGFNN